MFSLLPFLPSQDHNFYSILPSTVWKQRWERGVSGQGQPNLRLSGGPEGGGAPPCTRERKGLPQSRNTRGKIEYFYILFVIILGGN